VAADFSLHDGMAQRAKRIVLKKNEKTPFFNSDAMPYALCTMPDDFVDTYGEVICLTLESTKTAMDVWPAWKIVLLRHWILLIKTTGGPLNTI
jgi:hypothetical protein